MKPTVAPYDEDSVDDSNDKISTEGSKKDEPKQAGPAKEAASAGPKLKCEIKELETRPGLNGQLNTKEVKAKPDAGEDGDKEITSAMKAHKTFDREGNLTDFVLEIYSQHLCAALRAVIKEYPGQHFSGDVIYLSGNRMSYALSCLFHYRRELEEYAAQQTDVEAKMHVRLALKYLDKEFREAINRFQARVLDAAESEDDDVQPSIEFRDLWMLFKPGTLVLGRPKHTEAAIYEMVQSRLGTCDNMPCWTFTVKMFGHNGDSFGSLRRSYRFSRYDGTLPVRKLDLFPLKYSEDEAELREEQIERAKRYIELTGFNYRAYTGKAWGVEHKRTPTYWGGVEDQYPDDALQMHKDRIILDPIAFAENMTDKDIKLHETRTMTADDVSEDDLLICNFEIAGFSLREKRWCWFLVDTIHGIEFDDSAFASLLLPPAQARLVRALTRQHTASDQPRDGFDDIITNKGRGCIFLLHGPPGVGKTATVESVSDELRRPLYVMMSGDLGSAVEAVERNLQKVLYLVARWKAVLLIDEADVFLERRSAHDLARNSLVSIFLRLLEYFAGIMFLTTNRVDSLDQAFQSRIHLTLAYKPLDVVARAKLWRLFLARARKAAGAESSVGWPDGCIDAFAEISLNGRQIKNAVRTAHALALSEARHLLPDDVQVVLDTISEFEKDFKPRPSTPDEHAGVVVVNGLGQRSNGLKRLS